MVVLQRFKMNFVSGIKYIQVYNKIKTMIIVGDLKVNEKLPAIRSLSKILNVNISTVVKAYELLEAENYITKKIGSGTFVSGVLFSGYDNSGKDLSSEKIFRLDTGNPSSDIFPIDDFKKAINIALDNDGDSVFEYDETNGVMELKEVMVEYLKENEISTSVDNLMIISGAQQGLDIVSKTLIDYSDAVFVEEPTYPGALNVLKNRNAKIIRIPLLDDGIDIGILKMKIEKIKPKLLYVMPNFQNPTGISYSEKKKKKLIEMAEEMDFYILEDDFISDFKFGAQNNRTMKSYDVYDRVIYIKSFSKILMPGLRVGILCLPNELMSRANFSKQSSDLATSTLIQRSLYRYIKHCDWKAHRELVEKIYTERFFCIKKYINEKLSPYFNIRKTNGGINFFLELRRGYFSREFVPFMLERGVALKSGSMFYDNEIDDRYFRINIAREPVDRLYQAIDIIADSMNEFYSEDDTIKEDIIKEDTFRQV
ncbi:MocR-like pyridoxine biosynthesis transcription factor PdxR [Peptostreptococcus porci]